jgi:hypothetical protein
MCLNVTSGGIGKPGIDWGRAPGKTMIPAVKDYAASFGTVHSTNRKNRVLQAPATKMSIEISTI